MSLDLHVLSILETLYEFLDRSPAAVILLDEHRRILYANPHAAALARRGDGISLGGGGLTLARKQDDVRVQDLMTRALAAPGASTAAMPVRRPSGRRPYALFFARVSVAPLVLTSTTGAVSGDDRSRDKA